MRLECVLSGIQLLLFRKQICREAPEIQMDRPGTMPLAASPHGAQGVEKMEHTSQQVSDVTAVLSLSAYEDLGCGSGTAQQELILEN